MCIERPAHQFLTVTSTSDPSRLPPAGTSKVIRHAVKASTSVARANRTRARTGRHAFPLRTQPASLTVHANSARRDVPTCSGLICAPSSALRGPAGTASQCAARRRASQPATREAGTMSVPKREPLASVRERRPMPPTHPRCSSSPSALFPQRTRRCCSIRRRGEYRAPRWSLSVHSAGRLNLRRLLRARSCRAAARATSSIFAPKCPILQPPTSVRLSGERKKMKVANRASRGSWGRSFGLWDADGAVRRALLRTARCLRVEVQYLYHLVSSCIIF